MTDYNKHMTQDMLDVIIPVDVLIVEFELCWAKLQEAKAAANISLPATGAYASLPVLHGCRKMTDRYTSYWAVRFEAVWQLLSVVDNATLRMLEDAR